MNIVSHLKKIFNSYDFMGNRIKRVRIDTPENFEDSTYGENLNPQYRENLEGESPEKISSDLRKKNYQDEQAYKNAKYDRERKYGKFKDFAANKDYVDKRTTYTSELAKNAESGNTNDHKVKTPFKFPWLKKVFGKPHEEIFDELLYPRLPYEYVNPTLTHLAITTEEPVCQILEDYHTTNKCLLYYGITNKIRFDVKINPGDRINPARTIVEITRKNGTKTTLNTSTAGNNTIDTVDLNLRDVSDLISNPIQTVIIRKQYNNYTIKPDTWGYDTILSTPVYIFEQDITQEFFKSIFIFGMQKYSGNKWIWCNEVMLPRVNTVNGTLDDLRLKVLVLTLDNDNFKNYQFECMMYIKQNGIKKYINSVFLNYHSDVNLTTGEINFNFGNYPEQVYIKIKPVPLMVSNLSSTNIR